jgi:aryl-alcohol dehydrogenase-like predicted oxidoreductase
LHSPKGWGIINKEQLEYRIGECLRKLKTDYIDLYYAHTDGSTTSLEETMGAPNHIIWKEN